MKTSVQACFTIIVFFALTLTSYAQDASRMLSADQPITSDLSSGQQHRYTVKLKKNKFAVVRVMQKGIDLTVTLSDPDGKILGNFDSPNGQNGPEIVSFTTDESGTYTLEIKPFDADQPDGSYDISLVRIRNRAISKADRVDQLFTPWDNNDTPGAAVAIVQNGQIAYQQGYGMANLEYDIPIAPGTVFHIASVSKQFTAFAILLLQQQGKLSIDDDVRKYVPEVPDFGKTITLRHLIHHTSGLRDQWNLLAMAGWRLDDVITTEQIMKLLGNQRELNFNPGDEHVYCNSGYTLLAQVVERVSGLSFPEFTQAHIFEPLHMSSTLFYDDHEKIVKDRAYSYHAADGGYAKSVLSYANVGATSLFTTVSDLAQWALNFEDPVVGSPEIIEQMNTRAVLNNGDTISYAFGQAVTSYQGELLIAHGGADAGYRTYLGRFPEHEFAVIVFSNDAGFNPGGLAMQIAGIYLEDELSVQEEEAPEEEREEPTVMAEVVVSQDSLAAYVGEFQLQPGFVITVTLDEGVLFGQATGQPQFRLTPLSISSFKVDGVEATVDFRRDDAGVVSVLQLHQAGMIMDAPRMGAFDASDVDVNTYTGIYHSDELMTEYRFVVKDNQLVAQHQRHPDITLTPVSEDTFSGDTWFFTKVKMTRAPDGSINGCKISNGRVRDLRFVRQGE